MIISHWAPWFRRQYGGDFPSDYFAFDVETSGWNKEKDVIVEWGHCLVEGRTVVERNSVVINWFETPEAVPPAWLESQLLRVRRQMELDGRSWHLTPDYVREHGVSPAKALPWIYELLTTVQDQGMMMVTHNGLNFDCGMLCSHFRQDLGKDFAFKANQVMDTAAIEKASQLAGNPRALPQPGETLFTYFKRITGWRAAGIYHNLDDHCVKKYRLDEKYGITRSGMHSAGQDAYVLHLLMEEFRALVKYPESTTPAPPADQDWRDWCAETDAKLAAVAARPPATPLQPAEQKPPARATRTAAAVASRPQQPPPARVRGQRNR